MRRAVRRRIGRALVAVQELSSLSIAAPLGRVLNSGHADLHGKKYKHKSLPRISEGAIHLFGLEINNK
jgi:hypothetical protein